MRPLVGALLVVALLVVASAWGCGGAPSKPSSTPEGPPNTGLPIAQRTQDVVDRQNQRTAQLEQQSGSGHPVGP